MPRELEIFVPTVMGTAVYSIITLYMMAILLRWLAPFLSLDINSKALSWLPGITDPYLKLIRNTLPSMGFTDWAPIAGVLVLWVLRVLLVRM